MITLNPKDYQNALTLTKDNRELTGEQTELIAEIITSYQKNEDVKDSNYIKFRKLIIEKL